jgi:hypothetical protein
VGYKPFIKEFRMILIFIYKKFDRLRRVAIIHINDIYIYILNTGYFLILEYDEDYDFDKKAIQNLNT